MVQARRDITNFPLVVGGHFYSDLVTVAQDAARTVALAVGTVMAKITASGLWVPWFWAGGGEPVDGTLFPRGIYVGGDPLTAAAIAAGNVLNVPIMVAGGPVVLDPNLLVFDTGPTGVGVALTLATALTPGTVAAWVNYWSVTARDALSAHGMLVASTVGLEDLTT